MIARYGILLIYGIPETMPVLRGFRLTASPKGFLRATDGRRAFIVGETATHYRLFSCAPGKAVNRLDGCRNIAIRKITGETPVPRS